VVLWHSVVCVALLISNAGKFVNDDGEGVVDVDVRVVQWSQWHIQRSSSSRAACHHLLVMTVSNTHDGSRGVGDGSGLFVPFRRQSHHRGASSVGAFESSGE
jgi:hypothetical protein